MHLVPRHEQIVARVTGSKYADLLTILIGFGEIAIAIWIISGWKRRLNASMQIALILTMNTIEFIVAPDLLLWGRLNAVFALLFVTLIYYNEFLYKRKSVLKA